MSRPRWESIAMVVTAQIRPFPERIRVGSLRLQAQAVVRLGTYLPRYAPEAVSQQIGPNSAYLRGPLGLFSQCPQSLFGVGLARVEFLQLPAPLAGSVLIVLIEGSAQLSQGLLPETARSEVIVAGIVPIAFPLLIACEKGHSHK